MRSSDDTEFGDIRCGQSGIMRSRTISDMHMIEYAGHIEEDNFWDDLRKCIEHVVSSYELRLSMSKRARNCIDGKGPQRICEAIIKCYEEN